MKPVTGYAEAKATNFNAPERLSVGGYVLRILDVKEVNYQWGDVIILRFDIAEGEQKGLLINSIRQYLCRLALHSQLHVTLYCSYYEVCFLVPYDIAYRQQIQQYDECRNFVFVFSQKIKLLLTNNLNKYLLKIIR